MTIDLDRLVDNVVALRQNANVRSFAAVLKADAYGHGAVAVGRKLCQSGVVDAFVVALVEEGIELRQSGITLPILVAAGNYAGKAYVDVIAHQLTPIVGSIEDLHGFSDAASTLGVDRVAVHLEFDVGMARLGFQVESLPQLRRAVEGLDRVAIAGMMGHPSHAELPDAIRTSEQETLLSSICDVVVPDRAAKDCPSSLMVHMANSSALTTSHRQDTFELARIGLAIFGIQPVPSLPLKGIKPILEWTADVVALRTIAKGQTVGYDGKWTALRTSRIATLAVGYADGYPRSFSNRAEVLIEGYRARVVGAVCMDYTMIDITDIPAADRIGARASLLGQGPSAPDVTELALWADSISWEILSRIGTRVPRSYLGAQ